MSRKHYASIAAVLAGELSLARGNTRTFHTVRGTILSLAQVFGADNPRFDRARFYVACGLAADGSRA